LTNPSPKCYTALKRWLIIPRPISNDKRADIVRHIQAGESKEDIARWLFITLRTVNRVLKRYHETGNKEAPDMTLLELIEEFDLPFSESALSRRLTRLGLTYKKRHSILNG